MKTEQTPNPDIFVPGYKFKMPVIDEEKFKKVVEESREEQRKIKERTKIDYRDLERCMTI